MNAGASSQSSALDKTRFRIQQQYQRILDKLAPLYIYRWIAFVGLLALFAWRILALQGFYIVTYGLAIYLLNMLIGFLSPRFDPEFATLDEDELNAAPLPLSGDAEFKPFVRRIPEFRFWIAATNATVLSLFLTLFPFLDVPVFWPILLVYFCALFFVTMKRRIQHMYKHSYNPFSWGKPKYTGFGSEAATPGKPQKMSKD